MTKHNYKTMAALVASKLTKKELIKLAELLDGDCNNDFCFYIQAETYKVAPEIYEDNDLKDKAR